MNRFLSIFIPGIIILFLPVLTSFAQQGESGAKVIITEYSDYQCPACAYFFPIVNKLKHEYGNKLKVNYRYFPLNSHQYAALAARAAEAAHNQGKFKEMHDLLFQNQNYWVSSGNPQSLFIGYARDLGLDIEQFRDELNSAETQRTVMEQKKEGQDAGVNSTPSFFINGNKLAHLPRTYGDFKAIIESYMQEAN